MALYTTNKGIYTKLFMGSYYNCVGVDIKPAYLKVASAIPWLSSRPTQQVGRESIWANLIYFHASQI